MPEMIWYPTYRDEFAGGLYPFSDLATLVSDGGEIAIDPGMIIDAAIYPSGGGTNARIASIAAAAGSVTLTLGDDDNPATCSASFDPLSSPSQLTLLDPLGRASGILLLDPAAMAAAQTWPIGVYKFRAPAAVFVARCCFPSPTPGLSAIAADGIAVAGDVWLIGDKGVVLSGTPGRIRVDVVGDPLSVRSDATALGGFITPRFVRALEIDDGAGNATMLLPDASGNIQFVVGNALAADTVLRTIHGGDSIHVHIVGAALSG